MSYRGHYYSYFFISGLVSLNLLERNTVRSDIDCPEDTISYICSIQSNSETVNLVWNIYLPDSVPLTITYDNTSLLNNIDSSDIRFRTVLTTYNNSEYIESTILFNIIRNISTNGTILECSISDLDTKTLTVFANISCKSSASNVYKTDFYRL